MVEFEIAPGRYIGKNHPCFVIAEIGQNHQGSIPIAKELILMAADCKVDCVKFQKSCLDQRFTKQVLDQPYSNANSWGKTYGEHRSYLELPNNAFYELKEFTESLGLYFTATGMDIPSIDFLHSLNVPFFKIGSADTTNVPLLKHASLYHKPLVISTGMTHKDGICDMYAKISKLNERIALLQCTSCYPTVPSDVNLNVINYYKKQFPEAVIGYSSHDKGISICLAAVAMGAKIIEKHITLSNAWKGSDHGTSLEHIELKNLVKEIRTIEEAMGSSFKILQKCEETCYKKLGKTVVAAKEIEAGSILTEDMIDVKVAIKKEFDPKMIPYLLGKQTQCKLQKDETILSKHFIS